MELFDYRDATWKNQDFKIRSMHLGNTKWDVFTCVSVSMRDVATSNRFGRERYLFSLNWCSNSSSCWLVNAVLGLLHLPSRLDCAWAADTTGTATAMKTEPPCPSRSQTLINSQCFSCSTDGFPISVCFLSNVTACVWIFPKSSYLQLRFEQIC